MRDASFWKALLNIEDFRNEFGIVRIADDESFVLQCELYSDQLLLSNDLFNQYYIVHWDHVESSFVPFVIRIRYLASFAAAG